MSFKAVNSTNNKLNSTLNNEWTIECLNDTLNALDNFNFSSIVFSSSGLQSVLVLTNKDLDWH